MRLDDLVARAGTVDHRAAAIALLTLDGSLGHIANNIARTLTDDEHEVDHAEDIAAAIASLARLAAHIDLELAPRVEHGTLPLADWQEATRANLEHESGLGAPFALLLVTVVCRGAIASAISEAWINGATLKELPALTSLVWTVGQLATILKVNLQAALNAHLEIESTPTNSPEELEAISAERRMVLEFLGAATFNKQAVYHRDIHGALSLAKLVKSSSSFIERANTLHHFWCPQPRTIRVVDNTGQCLFSGTAFDWQWEGTDTSTIIESIGINGNTFTFTFEELTNAQDQLESDGFLCRD